MLQVGLDDFLVAFYGLDGQPLPFGSERIVLRGDRKSTPILTITSAVYQIVVTAEAVGTVELERGGYALSIPLVLGRNYVGVKDEVTEDRLVVLNFIPADPQSESYSPLRIMVRKPA